MKQTAIKWLQEQLKKGVDFNPLDKNSYLDNVEKLFEQAKQMEKEQIVDAHYQGYKNFIDTTEISEQYYNETYGK